MSKMGNNSHKLKSIPRLKERMQAKCASMKALAEKAGVCPSTVERARSGRQIHELQADLIVQALENHTFEYVKVGRKGRGTFVPERATADSIKVSLPKFLGNDNGIHEPDLVHSIPSTVGRGYVFPIHKTEAEISRMHEYNQMMGRGGRR